LVFLDDQVPVWVLEAASYCFYETIRSINI
jgi:hypothetical protein